MAVSVDIIRQNAAACEDNGWSGTARILRESADEIERLEADLDRKMGRRSDCKACGEKVPFHGAVYCSESCWRTATEEEVSDDSSN